MNAQRIILHVDCPNGSNLVRASEIDGKCKCFSIFYSCRRHKLPPIAPSRKYLNLNRNSLFAGCYRFPPAMDPRWLPLKSQNNCYFFLGQEFPFNILNLPPSSEAGKNYLKSVKLERDWELRSLLAGLEPLFKQVPGLNFLPPFAWQVPYESFGYGSIPLLARFHRSVNSFHCCVNSRMVETTSLEWDLGTGISVNFSWISLAALMHDTRSPILEYCSLDGSAEEADTSALTCI